jgi:hypothetical protein
MISGKKYVRAEAWQTISALNDAHWITEWSTPLVIDGKTVGVESKVNIVKDDRIISSGIMACGFDDFPCKGKTGTAQYRAAASSSQTWAGGKAARQKYAWIIVMAGYQATPAEEMEAPTTKQPLQRAPGRFMIKEQAQHIKDLADAKKMPTDVLKAYAHEHFEVELAKLTGEQAQDMIAWLETPTVAIHGDGNGVIIEGEQPKPVADFSPDELTVIKALEATSFNDKWFDEEDDDPTTGIRKYLQDHTVKEALAQIQKAVDDLPF